MLSQYVETRHAVDLLAGGHTGVGYLLKERITRPSELVDAVRRVAAGGTAIDPEVVRTVFDTPRRDDPIAQLTTKEREVLGLVAEGHSNDRIAERLDITTRTVEIAHEPDLHQARSRGRPGDPSPRPGGPRPPPLERRAPSLTSQTARLRTNRPC